MAKRKPVESADAPKASAPAVAPVVAEPKKSVRKTASTPKSAATSAAHKHHSKKVGQVAAEATVAAVVAPLLVAETPAPTAPVAVTHQAIARLAYSYWEARGYQGGSPEQDWLQAEQELLKLS